MKKYFVVEVEEDITADLRGYIVESYEVICAESAEEIVAKLRQTLGEHLVTYHIRRATLRERREYERVTKLPCIQI